MERRRTGSEVGPRLALRHVSKSVIAALLLPASAALPEGRGAASLTRALGTGEEESHRQIDREIILGQFQAIISRGEWCSRAWFWNGDDIGGRGPEDPNEGPSGTPTAVQDRRVPRRRGQ
jgi:hypothetical protein